MEGSKAEYCRDNATEGMADVRNNKCTHHGCTEQPSYGMEGSKAEYCRDHATEGMADVRNNKCTHHGCTTRANFGEKNTGNRKFCARHAEEGMIRVSGRSSGDSKIRGRTDDATERGRGTASRAGSGERQRSRAASACVSPIPAKPSSGTSRKTNKRARRSAGSENLDPVRVKREEDDDAVPDDEKPAACPEPEAMVKTADIGVPYKSEITEAAGDARAARLKRKKPRGGTARDL